LFICVIVVDSVVHLPLYVLINFLVFGLLYIFDRNLCLLPH